MPNRWALPACLAVLLSFMPSGLLRRLLRPLGLRPASRRASLHARVSGQPSSPKARTPHGSSFPAVLHRVLHRSDLKPGRLIIVGKVAGEAWCCGCLRGLWPCAWHYDTYVLQHARRRALHEMRAGWIQAKIRSPCPGVPLLTPSNPRASRRASPPNTSPRRHPRHPRGV